MTSDQSRGCRQAPGCIQGSRDGKLTLEGCRLLRNSQGIEWVRDLILTGSGSVISSNTQYGVLVQRKFDLTLTGCEVRGNGADGLRGSHGDWSGTVANLEDCTIEGNGGDGLHNRYGNLTVRANGSSFSANQSKGIGMGHSWGYTTVLALTNCVVVGNSGVGLDAYGTTVELPTTGTLIASNQVGIAIQTQGAKVEGLSGNQLFGNREFDLANYGPGAVVALGNTWGEPTPAELAAGQFKLTKIRDSSHDVAVGQVLIERPLPPGTKQGEISGSETWSGTITMVGDVTVKPTGSLTILPGTRIEADWRSDGVAGGTNQNRIELIVQGALSAEGTEGAPIVFTVFRATRRKTLAAGTARGCGCQPQQVSCATAWWSTARWG
ncbi:MAG: right-handed parallel beta-helix repeat-containing protein [Verrucomicrobiales bacterium]|nr:right-handed parallel beta-helix repeat-containing protein [Verrucomicrobiales bacterium]